ncbi:Trypanosome variant surface glycoprotein (A-type)/Trypanosome variant surface glycoprotein C-terminal domain containing protein, putative [Trypanosoma equiperdum]|uniref:Trypanosome variant surface glycoprotein (A-type)/Trypanosome variant surface glycoprotein C-terminal domain containing protein, putative n=1 Tax=Trypanosoma equiperdum TaxID=5694 RepID=A0A1G4I2J7_TRYEQ|nr:Trypanosome variant surface glycoprotein (A-type)/Trypanosome variant surface glycoprotein C-terminal domain containing protein, putative [Trypanosoma equiperdum]
MPPLQKPVAILLAALLAAGLADAAAKGLKASGANLACDLSAKLKSTTNYVKTKADAALNNLKATSDVAKVIALLTAEQGKPVTTKSDFILRYVEATNRDVADLLKTNLPKAILYAGVAAISAGRIDEFGELLNRAVTNQPSNDKFCLVQDNSDTTQATEGHLEKCMSGGKWNNKIGNKQVNEPPDIKSAIPTGSAPWSTSYAGGNTGCKLLSSDETDGFGDTAEASGDILTMVGIFKIGTAAISGSPFKDISTTRTENTPLEELFTLTYASITALNSAKIKDLTDLAKLGSSEAPGLETRTLKKADLGLATSNDETIEITTDDFNTLSKGIHTFRTTKSESLEAFLRNSTQILLQKIQNATVQAEADRKEIEKLKQGNTKSPKQICNEKKDAETCNADKNCRYDETKKEEPKCVLSEEGEKAVEKEAESKANNDGKAASTCTEKDEKTCGTTHGCSCEGTECKDISILVNNKLALSMAAASVSSVAL